MPRPAYIVCCVSSVEDKETNMLSVFNVIENIRGMTVQEAEEKAKTENKPLVIQTQELRILCSFMLDEQESSDDLFDFELRFLPPEMEPISVATHEFKIEKFFHRFKVKFQGPLPTGEKTGVFWIEARAKKKENTEWVSQRYPIQLEIMKI